MPERRTVYVLGAGFSTGYTEADYPVTAQLFQGIENTNFITNEERDFLREFIGPQFGGIKQIDIEDALAYCDLMEQNTFFNVLKPQGMSGRFIALRISEILKKYLNFRLYHHFQNENSEYSKWAQQLDNRDPIITFNYDILLESLLMKNGKADFVQNCHEELALKPMMKEYPEVFEKGLLLKLHGSLDWVKCPNINCQYFNQIDVIPEYMMRQSNICGNCSSILNQVLIYPGLYKRYEQYPKIGHLWNLATFCILHGI